MCQVLGSDTGKRAAGTLSRMKLVRAHGARLALANALTLLALWLFISRVGEATWLSGALCYIPQHLFALPTLILLGLAIGARKWKLAAAHTLILASFAHLFLGFNVPVASAASTWRRAPSRASGVRVMTYNILGASRGIAAVANTIRVQRPDIVFLQESIVISHVLDARDPVPLLLELLPGYTLARAGDVSILSRFPILATASHPLPSPSRRAVVEAVIQVHGRPTRALCVHPYTITLRDEKFSFPDRVRRSLGIRNEQFGVIFQALSHPPSTWKPLWRSAPVIMAGDFNTPPRGRIYNALSSRLVDSWRSAGWGTGDTFRADLPLVRIDYVWHSRHFEAQSAQVIPSPSSDHAALLVELRRK